ncbi:hypothetical protein ACH5RR_001082 [Cinchona calisaya]|uniref:Uncharacterized protein n=1 Tax=Cinchona calisaya TaxID=153742 RepID=A0ABD3B2T4_9GENT
MRASQGNEANNASGSSKRVVDDASSFKKWELSTREFIPKGFSQLDDYDYDFIDLLGDDELVYHNRERNRHTRQFLSYTLTSILSSIVQGTMTTTYPLTMVIEDDLVEVVALYENEWGSKNTVLAPKMEKLLPKYGLLSGAIVTEGYKSVDVGVNVMDLRIGLNMTIDVVSKT